MTRRSLTVFCLLAFLLVASGNAWAADSVSGTFTVDGAATKFNQIYATLETDPQDPQTHYLMLLVSDLPIPPADRTPDRLLALAQAGKIHALRMRWTYGTDTLAVVPYHAALADSGRAFRQMATIDITKYDDSNVDAQFTSKALGQSWQFTARIKAAVANGGAAAIEPDAAPATTPAGATAETGTAAAVRQQIVALGYQLRPEDLFQAIGDGNVTAVQLMLKAGISPNTKGSGDRYPLNHAVLFCARDADKAAAIITALVDAKGDVKTKDPDNKTTPLVGAVQSCKPEAIEALIKAGSDLTAKSAGGMTALQLADVFGHQDVAAMLRKAGAK